MRILCAGVMAFAVTCGGCGPKPAGPSGGGPGDTAALGQLKGTWRVTAIEAGGKAVPPDRVQKLGLDYQFDGDKVVIRRPGRPDNTSTVVIDTAATPKKMTINQSPPVRAVYTLDGDKLQLCVMVDENPSAGYPTEVASKASPKTDVLTLERR